MDTAQKCWDIALGVDFCFRNNTVFTRFVVYFQIQSETETIYFPVDFDMAAVRGVMRSGGEAMASMKAVTYTINLTHHLIGTT